MTSEASLPKISDRIAWLRWYHGLSVAQAAKGMGVQSARIKDIESTLTPTLLTFTKLVGFYKELNLHWLITQEGKPFFNKPEKIEIDIPEPKRRRSKFTAEQDQLIKDSWPELPEIEGFAKSQIKNRAFAGLGLRVGTTERMSKLATARVKARREARRKPDQPAYKERPPETPKSKAWRDARAHRLASKYSETYTGYGPQDRSTFTSEQDAAIRAAWPDYASVKLPHKDAQQVYNRGIRLGLPKLRECKTA